MVPIFEDLEQQLIRKYGDRYQPVDVMEKVETSLKQIESGELVGFIVFSGNDPLVVSWLMAASPSYNMLFFHGSTGAEVEKQIVSSFKAHYPEEMVKSLEVDMILPEAPLGEALLQDSFIRVQRDRMYLALPYRKNYSLDMDIAIVPLEQDRLDEYAELGVKAHREVDDIPFVESYSSMVARKKGLEEMFALEKDPLCRVSSLMLLFRGKVIGYIFIKRIKFFQHEKAGWIEDVVVDSEYHGRGLGKALLLSSMRIMSDNRFTMLALCVSCNNPAKKLYEKYGFKSYDTHYEYGLDYRVK